MTRKALSPASYGVRAGAEVGAGSCCAQESEAIKSGLLPVPAFPLLPLRGAPGTHWPRFLCWPLPPADSPVPLTRQPRPRRAQPTPSTLFSLLLSDRSLLWLRDPPKLCLRPHRFSGCQSCSLSCPLSSRVCHPTPPLTPHSTCPPPTCVWQRRCFSQHFLSTHEATHTLPGSRDPTREPRTCSPSRCLSAPA